MHSIHPNARITPAVRAKIARSSEPSGVLAKRFGVSTETTRKWRKRRPEACLERLAEAGQLNWSRAALDSSGVAARRGARGDRAD